MREFWLEEEYYEPDNRPEPDGDLERDIRYDILVEINNERKQEEKCKD